MKSTLVGNAWRNAAGNPRRVRSLTFRLDEPQPSFEYELDSGPSGAPVGRFGGPIGFDGHTRVGGRQPYGPRRRPRRPVGRRCEPLLEVQTLGNDDAARVTFVFSDKTVELSFESAGGFRAKVQGRVDD